MAIVFGGTKLPQSEIVEIQKEIYANWGTFRDGDVSIEEGHKSGADVYESKVSVNMAAYSSGAVSSGSDVLGVQKSVVNLIKIQFADTVDYNTLLDTRFERSMAAGAFNTVSTEFDNAVLQDVSPAIGQTMENVTWDGATTAQKALIAGLTPGAAQGSISAGAQVLAAASPTNLVNSLPAIILHNDSQSKDTPGAGLGDYKKVLSIATIDASTIAAQYALLYATLDPNVIANEEVIIFAPLAHMQLMKVANNSVGAASNQNFLFEGDKASYNGIEVKFKPLIGFMIASPAKYLKILFDLANDMNVLETGKMANGSDEYFYKNVQAYATWCTNQRYITLYGG
tara:strand:- start:15892 stop:16914 length:1023 start_codon:yes stop_codon:yes gene_type:complete